MRERKIEQTFEIAEKCCIYRCFRCRFIFLSVAARILYFINARGGCVCIHVNFGVLDFSTATVDKDNLSTKFHLFSIRNRFCFLSNCPKSSYKDLKKKFDDTIFSRKFTNNHNSSIITTTATTTTVTAKKNIHTKVHSTARTNIER